MCESGQQVQKCSTSMKQMGVMCKVTCVCILRNIRYLLYIVLILSSVQYVSGSHVTGTWNTRDFFKFLVKFGFQKTNMHNQKDTSGYIFGNITSKVNTSKNVTFAVLDRGYFLEYYGNRTVVNKDKACRLMFSKIQSVAYDYQCNEDGEIDFLRKVPCPENSLCIDEDTPWNVVKGYQLTFTVEDVNQPRFWYISLVACYQDPATCQWRHFTEELELEYDLWLVNGNPNVSSFNPLVYQFSFDRQDTVELYVAFFLVYVVLVPLQLYAAMRQHHPVTRLFTASLILEFLSLILILIHVLKFSLDGRGVEQLAVAGDVLDILSRASFMLLLLLLAKGWAVTRQEFTWKPLVFGIWFLYGVVHILLYVWNMTEVDIIEDIDAYQTWPGWLIIVFRTLIMVWFLFELRNTMMYEHNTQKLNFFLHFGASALVWFIYLPIIALIALQVSALWRFKLLLGITYSADCLAYCVMTHLLWPTRSEQYFLLAEVTDLGDELDEFNEATHVINSYTALGRRGIGSEPPDLNKIIA